LSKPIRTLLTEEQKLSIPALSFTLAMCLIIGVESFILPVTAEYRLGLLACSAVGIIYAALIFFYFLRFLHKNSAINWLFAILNGVLVSLGMIFAPSFARELSLIFLAVIIITSTLFLGRWPTYAFSTICFISDRLLFSQSTPFEGLNFLIEFLPIPIFAIVAVETICRMLDTAKMQVHRLEVLNMVAKSVTSSLEIKQVIALLNSTIQNALDADTYYVGLMENDGNSLRLELLFDDGEFYPSTYLPLENTLAGWVIHNRKSLFTGNLPEDMPKFGIRRFVVGQPKPSLSWMGTPLQTSERLLGLVAVASYKYYEFGKEDLQLLENVAQQASLAIDNAYHHAEVEEKSQLDSLTGAYNHRAFIQKLDETLADAAVTLIPVSVIMLDVDNFKSYNDNYGHLFGDKVLSRLTEVIRYHIRENDFVGRWGGEEFSITLQGADVSQVFEIARRIQQSMKQIEFTARDGSMIPAPTISQGISTYPSDAAGTYTLIDVADQRLYIAKNRGRNQIEPHQDVIEEITKLD
jgi:diguanylate cyclase (GGDEF)-like protein